MRIVWISILFLLLFLKASSQSVEIHGMISDDRGKPLPFVSAWISQVRQGALTNDSGLYRLTLRPGTYTVSFRSPGYKSISKTIRAEAPDVQLDLQLPQINAVDTLHESGDSIIKKTIAGQNKPGSYPIYFGRIYTKQSQSISGMPSNFLRTIVADALSMNPDHKGIVNLAESLADFQMRPNDRISREITAAVIKQTSRGVFNFNNVPELNIDFYQNTVHLNGLSESAFVSPLADNALNYYRYQLIGQFKDEESVVDQIRVEPINPDQHLFSGMVYVIDGEWQLYGVELHLSRTANMDFIDSVSISQQYAQGNERLWLPEASRLKFYGAFLGFKYSGTLLQVYQEIHADSLKTNIYRNLYSSSVEDYKKNERFWELNRMQPLTPAEKNFYLSVIPQTESNITRHLLGPGQNKSSQFHLLPYMVWGYTHHNYDSNTSFALQPLLNSIFYNTIEGWGVDVKVRYTAAYDRLRSLSLTPDVRYGFSDKVFNASLLVNYVYNSFRHAYVFGRAGTDFLDLNSTGTISPFLNSLTTLYLGNNYIKLYQSRFITAGTGGEVMGGVLLTGQLEYAERAPLFNTTLHTFNRDSVLLTSNNPLDPNSNTPLFPKYQALTLRGSVTVTFNQEYSITPDGRFILPALYPVVRINYREGIPTVRSSVNYNFISIDVFQDRLNEGIIGYTSFYVSAGKFLNNRSLFYPDYNHFHGGQSFFFDTYAGSFHFLNYYTYSTDKAYFEAHAEHNFAGYFLGRVPLLRNLGLQEIVGGSYLGQGTLPDYKEIYIGFKRAMLRLDYGFAFGRFSKVIQGLRLSYSVFSR